MDAKERAIKIIHKGVKWLLSDIEGKRRCDSRRTTERDEVMRGLRG